MIYNRNNYILSDSPIKKILFKIFNAKSVLSILDIGGCEGEESIRYSRLFPNSRIYIFEPLPDNQKKIEINIKKYGTKNVKLFPFAVSDKIGELEFYVSSGHPDDQSKKLDWDFGNKSSSLLKPERHVDLTPWIRFEERISVKAITLEHFLNEEKITSIDFLHLDVQGAELNVLKGAGKFLKNFKTIWLEVSDVELYKGQPLRIDIEEFMKENNFNLIESKMDGQVGDQFYINNNYYKIYSFWLHKKIIRKIKD